VRRFFELLGVLFFQLVAILSVTFIVSLLTWTLTDDPETQSGFYVLFFGLSISIGVFLAGWLSLRFHWLKSQPLLLSRLIGTALGAYLPLVIILLMEKAIRAGHPVFTIAMLTGILGFHLPTWLKREPA
jgi:hypothetical protein